MSDNVFPLPRDPHSPELSPVYKEIRNFLDEFFGPKAYAEAMKKAASVRPLGPSDRDAVAAGVDEAIHIGRSLILRLLASKYLLAQRRGRALSSVTDEFREMLGLFPDSGDPGFDSPDP